MRNTYLSTAVLHGYTCLQDRTLPKGVKLVNIAGVDDGNRLENLIGEDLDPKWNEPSTRGDLRLLAIRIDTKFDQVRGDFNSLRTEFDSKFEQMENKFELHANGIDSKFEQMENKFNFHANGINSKFEQSRGETRVLVAETNAKFERSIADFTHHVYRAGMIFGGAIITANLAMLSIFATLIK